MAPLPASKHETFDEQVAADYEAAQVLADEIRARYHEERRKRIKVMPQHKLRASSFGFKCDRRIYHDVVDWQRKKPVDPVVQGYFDRGNDLEPIVERKLSELGFRITQSQIALYDDEMEMTMHPDGVIVEDSSGRAIVVDIKSTSDHRLLSCRAVEALWEIKWGQRYIPQVTLYMRRMSVYAGLLIPWDGINWCPEPIPIPYDLAYSDSLAARAKRVNTNIKRKQPPDYIQDSRECRICPHFGIACTPPISFGKGAQIITDEQLVIDKRREMEIEAIGREWQRLRDANNARCKSSSDDPQEATFVVGPFMAQRKISQRKGYEVKPTKIQKITWTQVLDDKNDINTPAFLEEEDAEQGGDQANG